MARIGVLPPRPRANPLLGSALELRSSQIAVYERVMRDYGDVVRLVVGPPGLRFELYCVFHPDGVRRVLAGPRECFSKGDRFYRRVAESFGWGLLASEGGLWQRQRRLVQPLFTREQIAAYAELMVEEATAVAARWDRAAREGRAVDASAEMTRLALRVVGRAIFGDDVARTGQVLGAAFPVLLAHTFRRAISPLAWPASWPTPRNRQAARARRALYGVVDELIARRQRAGAGGDDLLSRLLRARDPDSGEAMDVQQVRDEALIFLLAGHETTSTALTFTLQLLGRHPAQQRLVHDELDAVLEGRPPTVADAPALARTTMAIKEALRLYPPAYMLARRAEVDNEIGGYLIPAGASVVVSQYATHRHSEFWDQADRFDPTRFTPEREAARHPYAYFPFGRGPRACIGSHFAMLEATSAIAVLLQRYRIHSQRHDIPLDTTGITLRPSGGVPIHLTVRRPPKRDRARPDRPSFAQSTGRLQLALRQPGSRSRRAASGSPRADPPLASRDMIEKRCHMRRRPRSRRRYSTTSISCGPGRPSAARSCAASSSAVRARVAGTPMPAASATQSGAGSES